MSNAKINDLKVSVFTGPVFRPDDPVYLNKYAIPLEFWKVVVMVKTDGTLSATAYIESQRDLINEDVVAKPRDFAFGEYKTYQIPVKQIEKLTTAKFGTLSQHDPLTAAAARDLLPAGAGDQVAPVIEIGGAQDLIL
jgi:endonuclease G